MAYVGARAVGRYRVGRWVAPWAAENQGQHLSFAWVIEASTLRPRDLTHAVCYRVLAVHGGPLAKMSGCGATPHVGQVMRPCCKLSRHGGRAVWDHC
ncbi:UNVERIFIED_CONTAM: hypothetical protein Sradi_5678000 [Sesamum radiatum]|uniref:Uncharacterized protein n=1 Tax=Sesamum radiatum TaxID=300843 RepID=A0AAW2L2Z9_SESRA